MLLPIAETSEVPYIQSPLNPPIGPIELSINSTVDDLIPTPELSSAPLMLFLEAETLAWS